VLSDYIRRQLRKGHSLDRIKDRLIDAGHDIKTVEKEIAAFERKEEKKFIRIENDAVKKILLYYVPIAAIAVLIIVSTMQMFKKDICLDALNKDNCYAKLAMDENNAKSCGKITDIAMKNECMQKLWQVNECLYMQRTGFDQAEIGECQRKAFVNSLA
jgi:hypothetical protein